MDTANPITPCLSELPEDDPFAKTLRELISIESYKNETDVREDFIIPLLKALGYSNKKNGKHRIERETYLQVPEIIVGTKKKNLEQYTPDYILQVNGVRKWLIDAKGPNKDCTNSDFVSQAYSYSIHREVNVQLFVLCNGNDFFVYRTSDQNYKPFIEFRRHELEYRWKELKELFSVEAFLSRMNLGESTEVTNVKPTVNINKMDDPIKRIIEEKKQASRIHNGPHPYFTKRAWNVVRDYILHFTNQGETVLDSFGGSGVTAIEAALAGRKSIHVDINPIAVFMAETVSKPINTGLLDQTFKALRKNLVLYLEKIQQEDIQSPQFWYPKDVQLPRDADVPLLENYFHPSQLVYLSYLFENISKIKDSDIKSAFQFIFSSMLVKCNKSFHNTHRKSGIPGGGDSGFLKYYRYQIPKNLYPEQNVLDVFDSKYKAFMKAQLEIRNRFDFDGTPHDDYKIIQKEWTSSTTFKKGDAADLAWIKDESIDYVFIDPPYGSKIGYLDCSTIWNSWQKFVVTDEDFDREIISGGSRQKSEEDYIFRLKQAIGEAYRVLKNERWMSVVFASDRPNHWHGLRDFAIEHGFEHVNTVCAPAKRKTVKKNQNPLTVFKGAMILNFRKKRSRNHIVRVNNTESPVKFVLNCAESTIVKNGGHASIEEIMEDLIPKLWESGFLAAVVSEIDDFTSILKANFGFDQEKNEWIIKPKTKIGSHIPLDQRIKFYIVSCLNRAEAEAREVTNDEIVMDVLPFLRNGVTPSNQLILDELRKIAYSEDGIHWKLKKSGELNLIF